MKREEKLEDSMLGIGSRDFKFYSVGRKLILRKLGNPFFGGDTEGDEWEFEEKMGTAWVAFTLDRPELTRLMESAEPRKAFAEIWEERMHAAEIERVYRWVLDQEGIVDAAITEGERKPGKPAADSNGETSPTG